MLAAAIMSLMIVVPAAADPLPEQGTLVIHKYALDVPGNGTNNNGTLLATPPAGDPLNGVIFNIYKIGARTSSTYPEIPPIGKYEVSGSTLVVRDKTTNAIIGVYAITAASVPTVTTSNNPTYGHGTAIAANLPTGYYLVVENGSVAGGPTAYPATGIPYTVTINDPVENFIVAVPMTNPTGDGWLTTVHVYPKNKSMSIEKNAKNVDPTYTKAVGDPIEYEITATIPTDISTSIFDAQSYYIYDEFHMALTYQASSLVVRAYNGTTWSTLIAGTDYVATYTAGTPAGSSGTLKVSFCNETLTPGRLYSTALLDKTRLSIEFTCIVNAYIYEMDVTVVNNVATLNFINQDGDPFTIGTRPEDNEFYSASIRITKVDAETGAAVGGAKFMIATSEANARAGNFIKRDADGVFVDFGQPGYAALPASAFYEVTTTIVPPSTLSIGTFKGLHNREAGTGAYLQYWIVETTVPTGYNKLQDPIAVAFDPSINGDVDFVYSLTVRNSKGFILPLTGGTGIIVCTVAGIILLGLAAIVALSRKKKSTSL